MLNDSHHIHDPRSTIECERCGCDFCAKCIHDEFDEWLAYGGPSGRCEIPSDTCPLTIVYAARRAVRAA